jgi:HTH-type transcriptional regulator / antitoxin HigA
MRGVEFKTEIDYERALARINDLMDADPGTPEGNELESLVNLVEVYEEANYPIDPPDPLGATNGHMCEKSGDTSKRSTAILRKWDKR